jgi:hypothetical protein
MSQGLVFLAKEETILQTMIDKLIEVGRRYGMDINVEETKALRILRQPTTLQIKIDKKASEECGRVQLFGQHNH